MRLIIIALIVNSALSLYSLNLEKTSIIFNKESLASFKKLIAKVTYNITSDTLQKRVHCGPFIQTAPNNTGLVDYKLQEQIPFNEKFSIKIRVFFSLRKQPFEKYFYFSQGEKVQEGNHVILFKFENESFSDSVLLENIKDFNDQPDSKASFFYTLALQIKEYTNQTQARFHGMWCKLEMSQNIVEQYTD